MEELKKKYQVLSIEKMLVFLLLMEILNVSSTIVFYGFNFNSVLLLTFLCVISIFLKVFQKKIKHKNSIVIFLLISYIFFFVLLGLQNVEVFYYFFYLIEISILLIFSEFKLYIKNEILVFYFFIASFFTIILGFSIDSAAKQTLTLVTFITFCLFLINFAQQLSKTLLELLAKSEIKTKELNTSNIFFKTILKQEQIKLFYVYPKSKRAYLIDSNMNNHGQREIPNILEYVRMHKIVPIEYFGIIQDALNVSLTRGEASIIIPISLENGDSYWVKLNGTLIKDEDDEDKLIVSAVNINEIKNVELKFKDALNKCSISTWEVDIANDTIIEYSDPILEYYFFGAIITNAKNSLINRNVIYYEDIDNFIKTVTALEEGKEGVTCELRVFPTRNSSYTWVRMHFTIVKDTLNKPSKAWVSIENINDAKNSEKLFEAERKRIFDDKSGLIIMMEINVSRGFVIEHSSKFVGDIKPPIDNSINHVLDSYLKSGIVITDDKKIYTRLSQENLLECYVNGKTNIEDSFKVITNHDDIIFISHIVKLFMDPKSKEIIAFSYFYDITEQRMAQLSLDSILKSKFVFLAYVNLLNSHLTIHKTHLRDLSTSNFQNRNYEKEWGLYLKVFIHPDDREYAQTQISLNNVRKQLRYKNHFSFEYRANENGNLVSLRRCHFIKTDDNDPIILVLEENIISQEIERIKKQLVLKDALSRARQAADAKSEFLSRMSHEIRTPLSAIIGLSELGISMETDDVKKYFRTINDSSNYLLGLLNDILVMNKLELGQVKLKYETVNIDEFNKFIIAVTKSQAQKKNINFIFSQDENYPKYQSLERLRIQQIIINIINNAIKYTNKGGEVSYKIEYFKKDNQSYSKHIIKDNGVGISKSFMKNIYTPFSREKNSLSDTEGGTGLGLAICANLIKQLEGTINIDSELNKGTTVEIVLPIKEVPEEEYLLAKASKTKHLIKSKSSRKNKKILIAEDHDINATVIQTMLNQFGIPNERVKDGQEVVEKFKNSEENEFSLILMDIMMPKLDGLHAAKQIRNIDKADSKTIKIIALSANAFDEDVERSYEFGMDDYLKKPINKDTLVTILNKYL